jgi:hypothetical protein
MFLSPVHRSEKAVHNKVAFQTRSGNAQGVDGEFVMVQ